MMEVPVALEVLVRTREEMTAKIVGCMPDAHREFLQSISSREPQWSLLEIRNVCSFPAVVWRLRKLAQLDERAVGDGPTNQRGADRQGRPRVHTCAHWFLEVVAMGTPELQELVEAPKEGQFYGIAFRYSPMPLSGLPDGFRGPGQVPEDSFSHTRPRVFLQQP